MAADGKAVEQDAVSSIIFGSVVSLARRPEGAHTRRRATPSLRLPRAAAAAAFDGNGGGGPRRRPPRFPLPLPTDTHALPPSIPILPPAWAPDRSSHWLDLHVLRVDLLELAAGVPPPLGYLCWPAGREPVCPSRALAALVAQRSREAALGVPAPLASAVTGSSPAPPRVEHSILAIPACPLPDLPVLAGASLIRSGTGGSNWGARSSLVYSGQAAQRPRHSHGVVGRSAAPPSWRRCASAAATSWLADPVCGWG
uniref:Uncharacterized protein n=1 Tax=Setaria viridis TaxID=4556 RepID=A0A4U6VTG1_SETVI|nr:hypothetical protein SEVIR_2G216450v2 [Setaria viridis]